ncbi:MAG: GIY-YIG nuclease family protein [Verrucomicrobiaceae bacterium]|nr:MAG: GIY-YIG nuclease family protein [Verrucomicrobiaceae bacterium]
MSAGRTVRLFLVEGSPTGIRIGEIINWSGQVLAAPRSKIPDALKRPELQKTGIYILAGDDPDNPHKLKVYVGEGDDVVERLKVHEKDASKEFWTHAYIVTSKDANLTKAHARYLESRVIGLVKLADRAVLANGNSPPSKQLPESDVADMEFFLEQVQVVLPLLGLDALRPQGPSASAAFIDPANSSALELILTNEKHGVAAKAVENDGEIVVLAGSVATAHAFVSNTYADQRAELIRNGSMEKMGDDHYKFSKNVSFSTPSAAAAVVLNRNSNGRVEWRLKTTGQTLKQWQDAKLQGE